MDRSNSHDKLSNKKINELPDVAIDIENDFASIRIKSGIESKSYEKDGFVFSEDDQGNIIEIQILNLSQLGRR